MDFRLQQKIKRLQTLKNMIKPKTFFDDLAEKGMLDDYINTYMPEHFSYDDKFQNDVLDLVFKQSSAVMPNIQLYILEKMHDTLKYFEENIDHA